MIIHKILNNNVVIVLDNSSNESVIAGRGIAYKKKVGDAVDTNEITKVFKLQTDSQFSKIEQLLREIDIHVIEIVDEIVLMAKKDVSNKLNESVYFSLIDHLSNAIERQKKRVSIKNFLEWEMKRFFPIEYEIGERAVDLVNKEMGVSLLNDEAGYIAFHIVNAELSNDFEDLYSLTEIMDEITTIITHHFKVALDKRSIYYDRFMTHLKFFVYRVMSGNSYKNESDTELFDLVKSKYKNEYNCVSKISDYLLRTYDYQISSDEQLYLMIHIGKLVKNLD